VRRALRAAGRAAPCLLLLIACAPPRTELVVYVSADDSVHIPDDVDELHISVFDQTAQSMQFDSQPIYPCGSPPSSGCRVLPLRIGLTPGPKQPDDTVLVRVEARKAGAPVISDAATFTFLKGTTERLDFVLRGQCLDSDCAKMDQACIAKGLCGRLSPQPYYGGPTRDAGLPDGGAPRWVVKRSQRLLMPSSMSGASFMGDVTHPRLFIGTGEGVVYSDDGGVTLSPLETTGLGGVQALAAISETEVYAVGDDPRVAHRIVGGQWTLETTPSTTPLTGVAATPTDVWAVGLGTLMHRGPAGWTSNFSQPAFQLRGVSIDNNGGYTVGDATQIVALANGNPGWTVQRPATVVTVSLRAVYTATLASAWAVGDGGWIYHTTDGMLWDFKQVGTDTHTAVWAASISEVFIGATSGIIYHSLDGKAVFTPETTETGEPIVALWGNRDDRVWALGAMGTVFQRQ
jgi:hypothetical protein